MDLNVHRAILFYALEKAGNELMNGDLIQKDFSALWLGNWMTDMNQASSFFSMADRVDPYAAYKNDGTYDIPKTIKTKEKIWESLFRQLWIAEIDACIDNFPPIKDIGRKYFENLINSGHIGVYYPYDHFDVTASASRRETQEFDIQNTNKFTKTIDEALYGHCFERLLAAAFRNKDQEESLFYLGRATHVLADFFAHTNFVNLLIRLAANEGQLIRYPSIKDYYDDPKNQVYRSDAELKDFVMSGRYDKIDTAASLLKMYKKSLVPELDDFNYTQFEEKTKKNDNYRLLDILFGTFSNSPFVENIHTTADIILKIEEELQALKKDVTKGIFTFFKNVDKLFLKEDARRDINEILGTAEYLTLDEKLEKNYSKAGRIHYYETEIAKMLHDELNLNEIKLPHHTLIAKDSDNPDPVKRLEYKLACCLAVEITKKIFRIYYSDSGTINDIKILLQDFFCHPNIFYEQNKTYLIASINEMYGVHWYEEIKRTEMDKSA